MAYTDLKVGPKHQMLDLMDDFDPSPFTERVLGLYEKSFARIRRNLDNPDYREYDSPGDALLKDYALCRGVLFPAGAQVVDQGCGFARSLMFKGWQALSVLNVLRQTGGNDNYYQYHTHLEELDDFNPEGFERFYRTVAEMLVRHPDVRGLYTGTWFLDPALREVSPHLAHIRDVPERNGASFFFQDVSIDTGALSKSTTRRRLYEEGKYLPRRYVMVWPRRALIAWAGL